MALALGNNFYIFHIAFDAWPSTRKHRIIVLSLLSFYNHVVVNEPLLNMIDWLLFNDLDI